jgi:hypothetical protein
MKFKIVEAIIKQEEVFTNMTVKWDKLQELKISLTEKYQDSEETSIFEPKLQMTKNHDRLRENTE